MPKITAKDIATVKVAAPASAPAPAGVVAATGVATLRRRNNLGKRVEEAMSKAVLKAMSEGIMDPAEQRKLMKAARDKVYEEKVT
jgi:hypothetical protein